MTDAKHQLRKKMKEKRRAGVTDVARAEAANAVVVFVDQLLELGEVETVSAYYPVRGEFDTLPLLKALNEQDIKTSLPVIEEKQQPLSFYPWKPGELLERGEHDIPVPFPHGLSVLPDLIIMPLLAFDATGHRLGYGGGYYDRTLEAMRPLSDVIAIGLAYDFQELTALPIEPHDQRLDYILTPVGLKKF